MKFEITDELIEAALHVQLIRRCQRAYLHELRNGLQGISTGIDLLTRMLAGKVPSSVPIDKANDMVRRAVGNYEHTMQDVIEQIIPRDEPAVAFPIAAALNTAVSLLNNDALAHGVTVTVISSSASDAPIAILARKDKFRLALMSLMIRAIDAMSNAHSGIPTSSSSGTLTIRLHSSDTASIDICSTPTDRTLCEKSHLWNLDAVAADAADAWIVRGIQQLIENNGGVIKHERTELALGPTCVTRLVYPTVVA